MVAVAAGGVGTLEACRALDPSVRANLLPPLRNRLNIYFRRWTISGADHRIHTANVGMLCRALRSQAAQVLRRPYQYLASPGEMPMTTRRGLCLQARLRAAVDR